MSSASESVPRTTAPDEWAAGAPASSTASPAPSSIEPLWAGDTGRLDYDVRATLLQLVKGPYLSASRHPERWTTLLTHRDVIASRLADLFLILVIDDGVGVAFTRNATADRDSDRDLPSPLHSTPLTFAQTVLLLLLRQQLVAADPDERVYIDKAQLRELAQPYLEADRSDERGLERSFNGAWTQLIKLNLLPKAQGEDRREISPILRIVFGADEITQLRHEYDRLLSDDGTGGTTEGDAGSDTDDEDRDA